MPPTTRIVPPKFQGVALGLEFGIAAYLSYELFRVYKGTHPVMSRSLATAGVWPPPPNAEKKGAEDEQGKDVRWMNVNGVPIPSYESLTGFWRR